MEGSSVGKLIELVLIVGVVYWFWSSQMTAVRKDKTEDRGKGDEVAPGTGKDVRRPPSA